MVTPGNYSVDVPLNVTLFNPDNTSSFTGLFLMAFGEKGYKGHFNVTSLNATNVTYPNCTGAQFHAFSFHANESITLNNTFVEYHVKNAKGGIKEIIAIAGYVVVNSTAYQALAPVVLFPAPVVKTPEALTRRSKSQVSKTATPTPTSTVVKSKTETPKPTKSPKPPKPTKSPKPSQSKSSKAVPTSTVKTTISKISLSKTAKPTKSPKPTKSVKTTSSAAPKTTSA